MNGLAKRLRGGERLIGAWCNLASPSVAEMAAVVGYDFVCADFQHGLIEVAHAEDMFRAIEAGGSSPVARAAWNEPATLGRLLDRGAEAVIVPMIDSIDDARAAVRACKYPPLGRRSFGPTRAVGRQAADILTEANRHVLLFPMVETAQALAAADEIAALDGVDGLFVGPADLSISLGLPPSRHHDAPTFVDGLASVLEACRRHGKVPGIQAEVSLAKRRFDEGFRFITAAMDNVDLMESFRVILKACRT